MLSCSNILYIDRPIYINSHRFHACSYQNSLHFKKWKISHFFKNFKFIETKQNKNWVESLYPSLFIYWSYFVAIHSAILSLLLLREEIFIWCAAVVDVWGNDSNGSHLFYIIICRTSPLFGRSFFWYIFFSFCTLADGLIVFFSLLYVWLIIQIGTKGVMNARLFFKNM